MSQTFPDGFMWGTATASYQIEGAYEEGGRGWSIWDAFSHTEGKTLNGDTGDVACDHYHRMEEDISLMNQMKLKYYRFSISWSRILPRGIYENEADVNLEGINFYNRLIDALLAKSIKPFVTLYHWDLPLELELHHNGWLNKEFIVPAFAKYAKLCFEKFGDRVKHWLTLNEPWCCSVLGYVTGEHAPGKCQSPGTEPYIAAHSLLLAHSTAVALYREEFQVSQQGVIGITLNADWNEPLPSNNKEEFTENKEAAERAMLFYLGWFADPIYKGDYPDVMRQTLGNRLPSFTSNEKKLILHSSDFFGLNHYSSSYASPGKKSCSSNTISSYWNDIHVVLTADPAWPKTDMGWNIVPYGFRKLVEWIDTRYRPSGGIIVTENGCAVYEPTVEVARKDVSRVNYFRQYLTELHKAIEHSGVNVNGYFAWSFCDNFEWAFGYSKRFGLHHIDFKTLKRTPKNSAKWFTQVIQTNGIPQEKD